MEAPSRRSPGGKLKGPLFCGAAVLAQGFILPDALRVLAGGKASSTVLHFSFPIGEAFLRLDPLAAFFAVIIALGGVLSAVYSLDTLRVPEGSERSAAGHCFFMGVMISSMLLVVVVQNALLFLIAWEFMSFSSFFLVIFEQEKEETRRAGLYYLTAMQIGAGFLIAAFAWASALAGSLDFEAFRTVLDRPAGASFVIFLLFLIGFGTKVGFVPLHTWLPRAHPAAPTGISALMSGVMIKTGIYGILRILLIGGGRNDVSAGIVFFVSLVTGIFGVLNAIARKDMKEALAFSSIENIGIIGMGIGLGMFGLAHGSEAVAFLGFLGAILHVFNHFAFKSLLFFSAGAVYAQTHTRNMDRLGGLAKTMPATTAFFLLGSLAICGLPPLSGFVGEFSLFMGFVRTLSRNSLLLNIVAVSGLAGLAFIGGMAVLCFTRIFGTIFLGVPRIPLKERPSDGPAFLWIPMSVSAALIVGVGYGAPLVVRFLNPVVRPFLPGDAAAEWATVSRLLGRLGPAALLLTGLTIFFLGLRHVLLRKRNVAVFRTWDCGYQEERSRFQISSLSFSSPFLRMAGSLVPQRRILRAPEGLFPDRASYEIRNTEWFDLHVMDSLRKGIRRFLDLFTWIQSGQTQQYILYGLIFLIVLIVWIIGAS